MEEGSVHFTFMAKWNLQTRDRVKDRVPLYNPRGHGWRRKRLSQATKRSGRTK